MTICMPPTPSPIIPARATFPPCVPNGFTGYPLPMVPASHPTGAQPIPPPHISPRQKASVIRPASRMSSSSCTSRQAIDTYAPDADRTILLYNLPYETQEQALRAHLALAGFVSRCSIKQDHNRSTRCRMTATATFRSSQQARSAVDQLDGQPFQGRPIKLRLVASIKNRQAVRTRTVREKRSPSKAGKTDRQDVREGPLVVDGSGPTALMGGPCDIDSDDEGSGTDDNN